VSDQFEPRLIGFLCRWCSYNGADLAGTARMKYPANLVPIKTNCSGRVDPTHILKAFHEGADGVLIAGCHPGDCHYINGNMKARRRIKLLKEILPRFGFDERRLKMTWIGASEGIDFAETMRSLVHEIKAIGPNEVRQQLVI
jgi:coenzyme F420-reducing hydrogenase delta subunit